MLKPANDQGDECLERQGPSPFVTRRVHRLGDGTLAVWSSRHHRKDLPLPESLVAGAIRRACLRSGMLVGDFNWWIGLLFAVGSLLFVLGSVQTLWPELKLANGIDPVHVFFLGSLPFTFAAGLQFFQAGNASDFPQPATGLNKSRKLFGCRTNELGWWSCFLQVLGTICFNFSTYQALHPGPNWFSEDVWVWFPNFVGSILFLLSGYMAFAETCHDYWRFLPKNLSWWAVFWNFLGCVSFILSSLLGVLVSETDPVVRLQVSTWFTLTGAIGFFIGSVLLLPEAATKCETPSHPELSSGTSCL